VRKKVLAEMRANFRPEFLNRVDDIVLFKRSHSRKSNASWILQLKLLRQRLADRQVELELTEAAKKYVARRRLRSHLRRASAQAFFCNDRWRQRFHARFSRRNHRRQPSDRGFKKGWIVFESTPLKMKKES